MVLMLVKKFHMSMSMLFQGRKETGENIIACWPNTPGIGQVEPNFEALEMLQKEIKEANN